MTFTTSNVRLGHNISCAMEPSRILYAPQAEFEDWNIMPIHIPNTSHMMCCLDRAYIEFYAIFQAPSQIAITLCKMKWIIDIASYNIIVHGTLYIVFSLIPAQTTTAALFNLGNG